ncbi:MAG: hypothetical protein JNJ75_15520 [Cyclobacteriaceae bacterium]|nr:hypothetical protein [Cyclobacteriaceae bacterium]
MGLFSTSLNVYKKDQSDIVDVLKALLLKRRLSIFKKIELTSESFQKVLESNIYSNSGVFYLITERYNQWTTIVELNVNLEEPFYLYELVNELSAKLSTYALSFHLHDDDVLLYNLERNGESLDGYNSMPQYFETDRLSKNEIISQRHNTKKFLEILPDSKTIDGLTKILDRGYWQAFDNNDLDEDGIPNDGKYDTIEEERLKELGQYLEIYTAKSFPYANWHEDIIGLDLSKCFLLKADK